MKWQKAMLAALVLAAFAAVSSTSAGADDVRLAAAVGVRQILLDLLPGFEAQTSHKVRTTSRRQASWSNKSRPVPASSAVQGEMTMPAMPQRDDFVRVRT
jgi:accessory colonization factor AcfC